MANYDSDITLGVTLDESDVRAKAKDLQEQVKDIFSESKDAGELSEGFKRLLIQLNKLNNRSSDLQAQLKELGSQQVPTEGYKDLQDQVTKLSVKLGDLHEKQKKFNALGVKPSSRSYQALIYDINKADKEQKGLLEQMEQMKSSGEAFTKGSNTSQYAKLVRDLNDVNNQMTIYTQRAQEMQDADAGLEESSRFEGIQNAIVAIRNLGVSLATTGNNFLRTMANMSASAVNVATGIGRITASLFRLQGSALKSVSGVFGLFGNTVRGVLGALGKLGGILNVVRSAMAAAGGAARTLIGHLATLSGKALSGIAHGAATAISGLNNLRKSLLRTAGNTVRSGLAKIRDSITSIGHSTKSSNSGIKLGLKTFLKYGLGVRSVYALVRKLRSALLDGFKNLSKSNDEFNTAMSIITSSLKWIRDSFAAALAPLVEKLAPVIYELSAKIVGVIRNIGQLLSVITGKDIVQASFVYTDYAESLDESSKSTRDLEKESKKLKRTLAGFDDVEILKEDKDDEKDEKKPDYSFVPGQLDAGMAGLAVRIKQYLQGIFDVIRKAWAQEGQKLIASIRTALTSIKTLLGDIAQTFYRVFTEGYGFDWLVSVFQVLQTIFDSITAIATEFDKAWNDNNQGYDYIASIFTMFTSINDLLRDIGQSFITAWTSGSGYELISNILTLFTNINLMIVSIADTLRYAWNQNNIGVTIINEIIGLFSSLTDILADIANDFAAAFKSRSGLAMVSTLLSLFANILGNLNSIADAFERAWNDNGNGAIYIKSLFDAITEVGRLLIDVGQSFEDAWNDDHAGEKLIARLMILFTSANTLLGTVANSFREAWNDHGAGELLINHTIELLSGITQTLTDITNDFARAFASPVGEEMLRQLIALFDSIVEWINKVNTAFRNAWNDDGNGYTIITDLFTIITNIELALTRINKAFAKAFDDGGIGEQLIGDAFDALHQVLGAISDITRDFAAAFDDGGTGEQFINHIFTLLDEGTKTIESVAASFRNAWNDDGAGKAYIDSIFEALNKVSGFLETVAQTFRDAWNDDKAGEEAVGAILDLFKEINTTIGKIADGFKVAWEDNGNGKGIVDGILSSFTGITTAIEDITRDFGSTFDDNGAGVGFINEILGLIQNALDTLYLVANAFDTAWNDDGAGKGYIVELETLFTDITAALDSIDTAFKNAWNDKEAGKKYIKSILDNVKKVNKALGDVAKSFKKAWEDKGSNGKTKGEEIFSNILADITSINELLGTIGESFENVWNSDGTGETIMSNTLDAFNQVLSILGTVTDTFKETFSNEGSGTTALKGILGAIQQIQELLITVGTDFENAWEDGGVGKDYVDSIWNTLNDIVTKLDEVAKAFKDAWTEGGKGQTLIEDIGELFTSTNEAIGGVATAFGNAWNDKGAGKDAINALILLIDDIVTHLNTVASTFAITFESEAGQEAFNSIIGLIQQITEALDTTVNEAFEGAWNDDNNGETYLTSISNLISGIDGTLGTIATSFANAWEEGGKGEEISSNISSSWTNIQNAVANVFQKFQEGWKKNGTGESIFGTILTTIQGITDDIEEITSHFEQWTSELDFTPILNAFDELLKKISPVATKVSGSLKWGYDNVLQPLASWTIDSLLPGVLESLAAAFDTLNESLTVILPALKEIWNDYIKPIIDEAGVILASVLQIITDKLTALANFISEHSEYFSKFVKILGLFVGTWLAASGVAAIIEGIVTAITFLVSSFNPIILGLGVVAAALAFVWQHWDDIVNTVHKAIEAVKEFFSVSNQQVAVEDLKEPMEVLRDLYTAIDTLAEEGKFTAEQLGILRGYVVEGLRSNGGGKSSADIINEFSEAMSRASISTEDFNTALSKHGPISTTTNAIIYGLKETTEETGDSIASTSEKMDEASEKTKNLGETSSVTKDDIAAMQQEFQKAADGYNGSVNQTEQTIKGLSTTTNEESAKMTADWDKAMEQISQNLDDLQASLDGEKGVSNSIGNLSDSAKTVSDDTAEAFKKIKEQVSSDVKETSETIKTESTSMKTGVTEDNDAVQKDSDTQWKLVKSRTIKYFGELVRSIKEKSYTLSTDVQFIFQQLATKIPEKFDGVGDEVASKFDDTASLIESKFANLQILNDNEMYNQGQSAAQSFADGFSSIHINLPHINITGWNQIRLGDGYMSLPNFGVNWYAKGGFPKKGELFVGNERGIEAMGKMGNKNVVANNQQIIDGIKQGVKDAISEVLTAINGLGTRVDFSANTLSKFNELNTNLSQLSQYTAPLVAQGRLLPASSTVTSAMSSNLGDILETLRYQDEDRISIEELRIMLIDIARNYISSSFYLGDEQLARHVNSGNLRLNRIYGQT